MSSTPAKKPLYKDLTFQVVAAMFLGIAFGFLAPKLAASFKILDDIFLKLIKTAVAGGRSTRPDIKLGVCGEHGGDPESVHFFHDAGLDYVSCSPFRVPVARLEAGRAALASEAGPDER